MMRAEVSDRLLKQRRRTAPKAFARKPAWLQVFWLFDDAGKMDVQLNANVENQDRAECGKNDAGRVKSSGYRARKHVRDRAADDPSDDAEHDCPKNRHVHVHY